MKILCISDERDRLVYSGSIKSRFKEVALVLSAGDLDLDYYGFIVSSLNKPLLFVFGNHNLSHIEEFRRNSADLFRLDTSFVPGDVQTHGATYIGSKVVRVGGLIIGGLGGSMRYNDGQNQYTEFEMFLSILKIAPKLLFNRVFRGRYLDILLTHAAPRGIQDAPDRAHRGFKVFIWFMNIFKPKYLVHGHIHLYDINAQRVTTYRRTKVVNAFEHFVIETEERNE